MDVRADYEVCKLRANVKALQYENQMLMGLIEKCLLKDNGVKSGKDSLSQERGETGRRPKRQQQQLQPKKKTVTTNNSVTTAEKRYVHTYVCL